MGLLHPVRTGGGGAHADVDDDELRARNAVVARALEHVGVRIVTMTVVVVVVEVLKYVRCVDAHGDDDAPFDAVEVVAVDGDDDAADGDDDAAAADETAHDDAFDCDVVEHDADAHHHHDDGDDGHVAAAA